MEQAAPRPSRQSRKTSGSSKGKVKAAPSPPPPSIPEEPEINIVFTTSFPADQPPFIREEEAPSCIVLKDHVVEAVVDSPEQEVETEQRKTWSPLREEGSVRGPMIPRNDHREVHEEADESNVVNFDQEVADVLEARFTTTSVDEGGRLRDLSFGAVGLIVGVGAYHVLTVISSLTRMRLI